MIKFDESKHPRAEDGRFTDGQNDARNKSIKQLEEEQAREVNRPKDIVVSANLTNTKNKEGADERNNTTNIKALSERGRCFFDTQKGATL